MTLPAIKWLRGQYETCHIAYLTDIALAEILEKSEGINQIETIDRQSFREKGRRVSALSGALKMLYRLKRQRFDRVFDLQGFGETAVIALLTGAPSRVGRVKKSLLRRRIYNSPIQADWEHEHRARYFLRAVAESCGFSAPGHVDPPRLPFKQGNRPTGRPVIGLNIGASTESRRWSEHNFFALAIRLSRSGFAVRIFLGPQETFLAPAVKKICAENNWEFFMHQRLNPLISAIADCTLLVSNDTGPGHLAAALQVPVITLFSTGAPENVRPLAASAKWFRNVNDINLIQVSEVEKACLELTGGSSLPRMPVF
ncbi:MAG: glycosyltransferase family 9 protein [Desulfobacterales bacterium]|nr:glycosyltransferase family 9 protein [Desulfobacterales bacterium]